MTPAEALLLGGLQGATEFLPVSSSGHLVLAEHLLGLRPTLAFNAALHAGTLAAVVGYYRRDLWAIIVQSLASIGGAMRGRGVRAIWSEDHGTRLALLIVVATVPTGVLGLALKSTVEHSLHSGLFTSLALVVTGGLLIATRWAKASGPGVGTFSGAGTGTGAGSGTGAGAGSGTGSGSGPVASLAVEGPALKGARPSRESETTHGIEAGVGVDSSHGLEPTTVTLWIALAVGVAQGLAVFPGISRSGATLATILLLGIARADGARFCFLLSIPAILGALVLEAGALAELGADRALPLSLGVGAAVVVGYISLAMLVALVRRGGLHHFAWYVLPLAVVGIVYFSR